MYRISICRQHKAETYVDIMNINKYVMVHNSREVYYRLSLIIVSFFKDICKKAILSFDMLFATFHTESVFFLIIKVMCGLFPLFIACRTT